MSTAPDETLAPQTEATESPNAESTDAATSAAEAKAAKDRDFTKVAQLHIELATYVNAHSGLDPISPNQVKALLYLRPEFNASPERAAERAERARRKAENDAKYAGLTAEQKKKVQAAERVKAQADRMAAKYAEAQAEADALMAAAKNSGVAAEVQAAQAAVAEPEPTPPAEVAPPADEPRRSGIRGRRG